MNGQEMVSIIVTFIVGFIFGIYIYFSGFLLPFGGSDVQSQEAARTFTLTSEVYGSCGDTCPSYQIQSDGSYRYLFTPAFGEAPVIRDGNIPRRLRNDLLRAMDERALEEQSFPIEPAVCNSFTDGIDVIYRVRYLGEEYEIDTCGTAIDTDSRLWNTLVKTWNYFETGDY
jgi:hypothetical protein